MYVIYLLKILYLFGFLLHAHKKKFQQLVGLKNNLDILPQKTHNIIIYLSFLRHVT